MKVLVTGATGFIGNFVIEELLEHKDIEIIASSANLEKAKKYSWFDKVNYRAFDFRDYNSLLNYYKFFNEPDLLIHLAWEGLPNYKSSFHTEVNLPRHKAFIENLILNGLKDVTITGTCLEYGLQTGCLNETMSANPVIAYAIAKNELQKSINSFKSVANFSHKWIRLFYMYGKGQNSNSLLVQLENAIVNEEKEFNMSAGEQIRDYLPIEIVADCITKIALQSKVTGVINCCSGKPISIKKLVNDFLVKKNAKIKLNLGFYPYTDYEPMAFWGDTQKLNEVIEKSKR